MRAKLRRLAPVVALATSLVAGPAIACEMSGTSVADIYPTGDTLPENLLRFYIYFSAPMGQDDILPSIALLDSDDQEVEGIFLSNRFDLWSADRTRLTLLLDPGRVKTGLVANRAMGRALVAGQAYQLRVAQTAQDAQGCPLSQEHSMFFQATGADTVSPAPENWLLTTPPAGTRDPLVITLDGAVDHLSLAYRLRALRSDGSPVAGSLALDGAETIWRFTPREPWDDAQYQLRVDPLLEDLAGNRMDAVFDLDLSTGAPSMEPSVERLIPFTPSPS